MNNLLMGPPAPIKLDFEYDDKLGCEVAFHNGYRIKAEREESPSNPFEDWDGNWPMVVRYDGSNTIYDKQPGPMVDDPLAFFTDAAIIHDQIAIANAIGTSISELSINHLDEPVKYHRDAADLREWFLQELGDYVEGSQALGVWAELYTLAGVPCLNATSRGYCQGDYAEVLVVATPHAQREFGCEAPDEKQLQSQVDLYGYWAWGNVYGYVIEQPCAWDEDGEVEEWEDIEGMGSCWGYYGDDHNESGLAEGALEAVPDEPVRSPDALVEEAA